MDPAFRSDFLTWMGNTQEAPCCDLLRGWETTLERSLAGLSKLRPRATRETHLKSSSISRDRTKTRRPDPLSSGDQRIEPWWVRSLDCPIIPTSSGPVFWVV